MPVTSREDDLLSKLKNCVGSLTPRALTPSSQSLSHPRPCPLAHPNILQLGVSRPSSRNPQHSDHKVERQQPSMLPHRKSFEPTANLQMLRGQGVHTAGSHYQSVPREVQTFGNQFREGPSQKSSYPPPRQSNENYTTRNDINQVRKKLASRYSAGQPYHQIDTAVLQQRYPTNQLRQEPNKLLNSGHMSELSAKYRHHLNNQGDSWQRTLPHRTSSNKSQSAMKEAPLALEPEKVSTHRSGRGEVRQHSDVRGEHCSALAKLKKISELNEKINERIRNIISVFEDQRP